MRKLINQQYELYRASLNHSTDKKDLEYFEQQTKDLYVSFLDGIRDLDDGVYDSVSSTLIMSIRLLFRTYKPKDIDDATEIVFRMLGYIDDKTNYQMIDKGWGE